MSKNRNRNRRVAEAESIEMDRIDDEQFEAEVVDETEKEETKMTKKGKTLKKVLIGVGVGGAAALLTGIFGYQAGKKKYAGDDVSVDDDVEFDDGINSEYTDLTDMEAQVDATPDAD